MPTRCAPQLPLPRISHPDNDASPPPNPATLHLTPTNYLALLLCRVLLVLAMARAAPLRFPRALLQRAVKGSSATGCTHT
jgi:hypothetical protein